jgi:hypothetical protein
MMRGRWRTVRILAFGFIVTTGLTGCDSETARLMPTETSDSPPLNVSTDSAFNSADASRLDADGRAEAGDGGLASMDVGSDIGAEGSVDDGCVPKVCSELGAGTDGGLGAACGIQNDGCGHVISCSTCGAGTSCLNGQCASTGPEADGSTPG